MALHVRTGEPSTADAVDAWFRAHAIEPLGCVDAYEACVHLLMNAAHVPDLVFVGADWLAPDEQIIIRYARETWPAVGIVVYGGPPAAPLGSLPRMRVCSSRGDLAAVLSGPPSALIEQFAAAGPAAEGPGSAAGAGAGGAERAAPRGGLSRAELSSLLDNDDC